MNEKPQLTDVKTLRARARQHTEKGAVTDAYLLSSFIENLKR